MGDVLILTADWLTGGSERKQSTENALHVVRSEGGTMFSGSGCNAARH